MRRTLATLTLATSLVFMPNTASADTTCQEDYWKTAYERAEENYWEVMEENVVLWNNIDYQNRKLDNKQATIDRLRAKIKHLKGDDNVTLDFN